MDQNVIFTWGYVKGRIFQPSTTFGSQSPAGRSNIISSLSKTNIWFCLSSWYLLLWYCCLTDCIIDTHNKLRYLSKKRLQIGRDSSRLLREDKIANPSRLYYCKVCSCIIAKFANSVNTYAHTYGHRSCVHFVNFANVSTRIARTLREHTLLASLREVFVCVSLPFFWQVHC